ERVVVLRRTACTDRVRAELSREDFLAGGEDGDDSYVRLEANEPAYILATSGTSAKPKLAVHAHGGYQVYVHSMAKWVFALRESDVWWSTSDIGWVRRPQLHRVRAAPGRLHDPRLRGRAGPSRCRDALR